MASDVSGSATRQDPSSRRWAFLANLDFESWEVERVADALADLGYDGVEWTLSHFDPRRRSIAELEKIVSLSEARGLAVSEIVVQQDFVCLEPKVFAARVELTRLAIEAAAATGIRYLNVLTGPARWEPDCVAVPGMISEGKAWDLVFQAYDALIPAAEEHGVQLAFEACWGMLSHDYYSLSPLLERYGSSPAFAINMDPSHFVLYGNDIGWVIRNLGRYIRHVHMKDVIGVPGMDGEEFMFPLLGEGRTDWRAFFEALGDVGFDGFHSVEFESYRYYEQVLGRDPIAAARLSLGQLRALDCLYPTGAPS